MRVLNATTGCEVVARILAQVYMNEYIYSNSHDTFIIHGRPVYTPIYDIISIVVFV